MTLVLFRIDERLLHGQVIVGWGMRLGIDYYVVVDDDLAASEWEREIYSAGLPDGTAVDLSSSSSEEGVFTENGNNPSVSGNAISDGQSRFNSG